MAQPKHDNRRRRRRGRRLLPLWLIAGLIGLGVALAAYQQQRRGAIDVAEAPQETPDRVAEAPAEPVPDEAPPPAEVADAASSQVDDAETAAPATDEPPATATPEAPAAAPETRIATRAEGDPLGRPAPASDGPVSEPAAVDEPAEGPGEEPTEADLARVQDAAPSEAPAQAEPTPTEAAPASSGETVAALGSKDRDAEPQEAPGARVAAPATEAETPDTRASEARTSEGSAEETSEEETEARMAARAPEQDSGSPGDLARTEPAPPSPRDRPAAATGSLGERPEQAARSEASPGAAGPGRTEALAADTIRRALEALLGGALDQPVAPPPPAETEDALARLKAPAGASPPETRMAAVDPAEESTSKPVTPSFDLVRVERDGQTVIAGRAAPGAEVELRAGDEPIDRVRADRRGHWVSVPARRLPPGQQELTLAARTGDGQTVPSEQVVVLAVPGSEPVTGSAEHPAASPVALEAPDDDALAVLLPRDGEGRGRVLQAPGRIGSDGELALLMLDYDQTGDIQLSGEALPGAAVRVYVDNRLSAETVAGGDGAWTCTLDRALAPGSYTLRVDQVDGGGQTVARLETPFTRVARPPQGGDPLVDYVVVQPGNSLWRIARRLLGSGFSYVHIYEANQAQIRDPDLIYPGQVFEIPVGIGGAG